MKSIDYRLLRPGEEEKVCKLVSAVFDNFVAPHYSEEGRLEFLDYVTPEQFRQRGGHEHFVLVAAANDKIVGMIEMRQHRHVSLLFVDRRFQKQGISRELLRRALIICLETKPKLRTISVNSSPNAVNIYEKLGFRQAGAERVKNGIKFTPMIFKVSKKAYPISKPPPF